MSLVLDSLEIKNFRAFKHLRIEKLGRVNLIVGKNNVGKSSVLEAIMLYANRGEPYMIFDLLRSRNEIPYDETKRLRFGDVETQERVFSLRFLFHGRQDTSIGVDPLEIGSLTSDTDRLKIQVLHPSALDYIDIEDQTNPSGVMKFPTLDNLLPRITVGVADAFQFQFPLDRDYRSRVIRARPGSEEILCIHVKAEGLELDEVGSLWDSVVLSDLEQDVLAALNVIAPQIEAVNLVGNGGPKGERIPKARVVNGNGPIPLRSMGEGMSRMFGIALALVNAKDGMLLIDEVDTGLHYSVLPDLWKLIFEVAHRLNVQVFATTHSKDCLDAFQYAADENTEEEGVLIRLENRKAGVGAVTFDEEELAIVTRERIEVR